MFMDTVRLTAKRIWFFKSSIIWCQKAEVKILMTLSLWEQLLIYYLCSSLVLQLFKRRKKKVGWQKVVKKNNLHVKLCGIVNWPMNFRARFFIFFLLLIVIVVQWYVTGIVIIYPICVYSVRFQRKLYHVTLHIYVCILEHVCV